MNDIIDIHEILKLLPHRYPFVLVDRVLELVPEDRIIALKNVTINEPFFQGHFPGAPIMPGVLMLEALAQAGGILCFKSMPQQAPGSSVLFMGMDKVKFRKPVTPGDQLILDVHLIKLRGKVAKMSGVAKVNENTVTEAELLASFGDG